jgi:hypothetical protein
MFPMFRGWWLRILAIVTYETATRSVAVDKQWTGFRRHTTILIFLIVSVVVVIVFIVCSVIFIVCSVSFIVCVVLCDVII